MRLKTKKRGRPSRMEAVETGSVSINPGSYVKETVGFQLLVENFLPTNKRHFKPELKEAIKKESANLKVGQSFFIPKTEMSVSSIRMIMKEERENNKVYKNRDIRIVGQSYPVKGCRIARYS